MDGRMDVVAIIWGYLGLRDQERLNKLEQNYPDYYK